MSKSLHLIHQKYRPDIDGLRAVAILPVVIFHAFPARFPSGFLGVDIFFVISGYLISTIIFSSLEHDRFSLGEFYIRRIRRIFPALILVMLTCFAFGWFVLLSDEFNQLGKHLAAGAGFISNLVLWNESGYFDNSADSKPLLHLWSLAIEEQFYIFWPLFLVFVWKRHWSFLKITAVIAVVSFGVNIYLIGTDQIAAFYSPLARFWELMVGGILAYLLLHQPRLINQYKNVQSVVGFILIVTGLVLLDKERAFPGWWALLPVLGAFFIISAGPKAWLNEKVLSNKVMVWFGLISYPLYLWHWPLLSFAGIIEAGEQIRWVKVALIILAVFLSWLTYRYIEKPIRFKISKRKFVILLVSLMSGVLLMGVAAYNHLIQPRNNDTTLIPIVSAFGDWEYPGSLRVYDRNMKGVYISESNSENVTLFIGDSHIQQYSPRIVQIQSVNPNRYNTAVFITGGGCQPIPALTGKVKNEKCTPVHNYGLSWINKKEVKNV